MSDEVYDQERAPAMKADVGKGATDNSPWKNLDIKKVLGSNTILVVLILSAICFGWLAYDAETRYQECINLANELSEAHRLNAPAEWWISKTVDYPPYQVVQESSQCDSYKTIL